MLKYLPEFISYQSGNREFYCKNYKQNLFCELEGQAKSAYDNGSGGETRPKISNKNGKTVIIPAKMASIASSSAMTFNLLGNEPAKIITNNILPEGEYEVHFEKQMYTLNKGSNPANLDAFLGNENRKTAIFCEMKLLEWLGNPSLLKSAYSEKDKYFDREAYDEFSKVIDKMKGEYKKAGLCSTFKRYDAWQMLKHLLSIYNYTSFITKDIVNSFNKKIHSMAGRYTNIILVNIVNEFPPSQIEDEKVRQKYEQALQEEHRKAKDFIDTIKNSGIPALFEKNCRAKIDVMYITAKQFSDCLDMSDKKRKYLRRYF